MILAFKQQLNVPIMFPSFQVNVVFNSLHFGFRAAITRVSRSQVNLARKML